MSWLVVKCTTSIIFVSVIWSSNKRKVEKKLLLVFELEKKPLLVVLLYLDFNGKISIYHFTVN